MAIEKVGVVGCGAMGAGIVQVCAQSGHSVIVSEINDQLLKKGLSFIGNILDKNVAKGNIKAKDKETITARIAGTTDTRDFRDCDLVIEAAIEDLNVKKRIFLELDKVCQKKTILATNTSCLSVTDLATATKRPDKVLGMHFFNPVPVMKLVEIVKTIVVNEESILTATFFAQSLGKEVIVARDTPGFIVNRLLIPFILNAVRTFENGVAGRDDIDVSVRLGLGHQIGPLALADLIGLDVVVLIADAIYQETRDPQYIAPILARKMVAAGLLGRKAGKGFYEYVA
jgi:3-hydroxybutyryl-CoA dehydrogenase